MKKILVLLAVILVFTLTGCDNAANPDAVTEIVPADYGKPIEMAQSEFHTIYAEFEELQITNTSTMARTDDEDSIIVQITYSSKNGDGVYGFEFQKDEYGNFEIVQQGEDVTIDNLLK